MLDSGCTFHICPNRSLYHEYKSIDGGSVLMGNNNGCKIVGIGYVKKKMYDGVIKTLHGVRHALELKRNLISLSMLDSLKYSFNLDNVGIRVTNGGSVVMKGEK